MSATSSVPISVLGLGSTLLHFFPSLLEGDVEDGEVGRDDYGLLALFCC